ncbi:phosphatidylglycerol---prolipoprotein diacylglyceryl transferase [Methylomarinovum caldicuralii]|uniref:Phosphatidylglycerol--prolipoprotein diacylglyceryl transferase n=1 Tax=Methylomarinovum caldicuralii TaxID=438856 RepID=A0AAU9BY71_9GAMM|nr:prolipoprotein diacylglyceryl transferase [Methylomarinovum caldicuralii]BCX81002.1 phosphatidylglycerol---prolipoprotein diacylglyceryl transferase [Methylomarinovum caldicuralii]
MLPYPRIDPVAVQLGPLKVHWYGLMYVFGLLGAWWLARWRGPRFGWRKEEIDDLVYYAAFGVVLGGRTGYMLFYNLPTLLHDPLSFFRVWEGGMSFHGGLLGVLAAVALFARKYGRAFWEVTDFIAPFVPIGLFFGRIGNFINGELWGKVSDVPWSMVFPTGGPLPRHPSQLYEASLEGIALFAILWWYSAKPRPRMAVSGLFLLGYGVFRFLVEFIREPDAHIGYLAFGWVTMGQVLSLPMIVAGTLLLWWAHRRENAHAPLS